ncbi:Ancient ubiquitous protein 1 [Desmophyllum pertusum]|uniref:Lipid droplet-regulating VLDL assembly factor AUP1 n=1 Tax=Desmophyllum pertusum TaxID=174260 RepID=A0A9W9YLC1_9CNID|nr:Ancient ubiquitous protein 1 [Desmophyllum pertusum]
MAQNLGIYMDLFNHNRLPDGGALLLLLLYIPCGLFLMIFRIFFGLQLILILTILPKKSFVRRILFRVSCAILGIAVTQEGCENYNKGLHKQSRNILDNVAIETVLPSLMPYSRCDCPWLIKWLLGYEEFIADKDRENTDNKIKEYLQGSDLPLLAFPEEQITNGKRGLLKFNPWCFQFSSTVLPVLISVRRPLIVQIPPHVLESGWWQDLFWSMFVPYTLYHIRVLPPIESKSDDVSSDVQRHMASSLGVTATSFTAQDVNELIKHINIQAAQARVQSQQPKPAQNGSTPPNQGPSNASPNTRLMQMVQQVKEVLPQVPSPSIARDLSRTHCVDTTITNILEGRVSYVPEKEGSEAKSASDVKSDSNETTPTKPQTITFSRLPEQRQQLLTQRKAEMLENARRRFRNNQA